MHVQLGQSTNNKIQKSQNPTATSQVPGAKVGYHAWSLHTASARRWADHLRQPSCRTHRSAHTLTPFKGPAHPLPGSEQGHLLLILAPSRGSTRPNKALPEFLIWPLINFYWLRSPRTRVGNNVTWLIVEKQDSNLSNPIAESST